MESNKYSLFHINTSSVACEVVFNLNYEFVLFLAR